MTAALAAVAVVAALALLAFLWSLRRVSATVAEERERAEQTAERLRRAVEDSETSAGRVSEAERRAGAAERVAEEARKRTESAESLLAMSQREAVALAARAESAERRADSAESRRETPGPAWWELERIRIEREWYDLVGPGVDPPAPWDGTLNAAIATDLAVIREVVGTPGALVPSLPVRLTDLGTGALSLRLAAELLRTLARSGEEMVVRVEPGMVTVEQPARYPLESLAVLNRTAHGAGAEIDVVESDHGVTTRLHLPPG